MDAAVMDHTGKCGAVAGIKFVKNPVIVAKKVMDVTPHVIIAGEGAIQFARKCGFPHYNPVTEKSIKKLEDVKQKIQQGKKIEYEWLMKNYPEFFHGTVGAVARDGTGGFASAVSTGGTATNIPGRIGDSCIIGAGLFAGPSGAVGATGLGEEIIRKVLSKSVYDEFETNNDINEVCKRWIDIYPSTINIGLIAVSSKNHAVVANKSMAHAVI